ncbi:nucleotide-binding alpha-beta plait domain-containing protein [Artemisia annua]|uniref:Nucleotide-binding alpha-beta plait domain-containing protein n=1 Tax=Artemisia annua TaxID=35608 RepID=A0A2U1QPL8_ARTAN|nr:nucleotide-binding alpha-beta plait domain-containing protein [Artemisia annua]
MLLQTMKSPSPRRLLFDNVTTKKKRTIVVSNLGSHTLKSDIYDYFDGMLKAKVTNISFNSFENKYYNRSCLVTFSSIETAKRVRKIERHHIQGVEVTVERYRGKGKHQKLFQRGEHDLFIKGINEVYILHRLCEDIAARCGPHSGIDFRRNDGDGKHNGEVVISFYEETHRQMALILLQENISGMPLF